jgi:hypothetical protein
MSDGGDFHAGRSPFVDDAITLSLTAGTTFTVDQGTVVFNPPVPFYWSMVGLRAVSAGLLAAFQRLEGKGVAYTELYQTVKQLDGPRGVHDLDRWLGRLAERALLARTLLLDGIPLATLQPVSPYFQYRQGAANPACEYRLCRALP